MATERTLSIIKPDATKRNLTGKINAKFEEAGLRIVAQKRIRMTRAQAEGFYAVHKERPFYGELVEFMTSGPVIPMVHEANDAVAELRAAVEATVFGPPRFPVWSNATASPYDDDAGERLLGQITSPVRFGEMLAGMAASGVEGFVHVGPGDVTAGLARRSVQGAEVLVVSSLADIDRAVEVLGVEGTRP